MTEKSAEFCAIGTAAVAVLLAACQSPSPVREYRVDKHTVCSPCSNACVTSTHVTAIQRNVSVWPVAEKLSKSPYIFTPRAGVCPPALNPPVPTRCTSALQEYPDGIHRLAGGPLYYESQNANWEQAPPFGRW